MSELTLYPSAWLYNAGVMGLLRLLEAMQKPFTFSDDGTVTLSLTQVDPKQIEKEIKEMFDKWVVLSPKGKSGKSLMYGSKDAYYANQTENSIKERIKALCDSSMPEKAKKGKGVYVCSFCTAKVSTSKTEASFLNQAFSNILFGSGTTFPNMYWGNSPRDYICPQCEFIVMCHHLAFTPLADGSEIFINAPSFRVMYYLNKFAQKVLGAKGSAQARQKRDILAMSVMEYAIKIHTTLGLWTGMNIELIQKKVEKKKNQKVKTKIEFFSLPYEVTRILLERRIAEILARIGELTILQLVLEQDFARLVEIAYRLLRMEKNSPQKDRESDNSFIEETLYLQKNRNNVTGVAQNILILYALIEEKRRKL